MPIMFCPLWKVRVRLCNFLEISDDCVSVCVSVRRCSSDTGVWSLGLGLKSLPLLVSVCARCRLEKVAVLTQAG